LIVLANPALLAAMGFLTAYSIAGSLARMENEIRARKAGFYLAKGLPPPPKTSIWPTIRAIFAALGILSLLIQVAEWAKIF
jgi:hypothetical protein